MSSCSALLMLHRFFVMSSYCHKGKHFLFKINEKSQRPGIKMIKKYFKKYLDEMKLIKAFVTSATSVSWERGSRTGSPFASVMRIDGFICERFKRDV
jgi:hypothetical protein